MSGATPGQVAGLECIEKQDAQARRQRSSGFPQCSIYTLSGETALSSIETPMKTTLDDLLGAVELDHGFLSGILDVVFL